MRSERSCTPGSTFCMDLCMGNARIAQLNPKKKSSLKGWGGSVGRLKPEGLLSPDMRRPRECQLRRPVQPFPEVTSKGWAIVSLGYQLAPDLVCHFTDEVTSLTQEYQLNHKQKCWVTFCSLESAGTCISLRQINCNQPLWKGGKKGQIGTWRPLLFSSSFKWDL